MCHKPGIFQKAKAPFYFLLPWGIVGDELFIAEVRFVQVIAGQDKTAFLLNRVLSCLQYRGNVCGNAISDRVRRSVLSGTPFTFEAGDRDNLRIM